MSMQTKLRGRYAQLGLGVSVLAVATTATVASFTLSSSHHHTNKSVSVEGEHFQIPGNGDGNVNGKGANGGSTGTSTGTAGTATTNTGATNNTATNNGNGNSATNGNTAGSQGKAFAISGALSGLTPGATGHLMVSVTNPNNQDMKITSLSATLLSVTKAANAPTGTCASSAFTVGAYVGSYFTVTKNTTRSSSPGYIPVTLSHNAPNACQGATFNLSYSGTGSQA
jgi:hypothetical protein